MNAFLPTVASSAFERVMNSCSQRPTSIQSALPERGCRESIHYPWVLGISFTRYFSFWWIWSAASPPDSWLFPWFQICPWIRTDLGFHERSSYCASIELWAPWSPEHDFWPFFMLGHAEVLRDPDSSRDQNKDSNAAHSLARSFQKSELNPMGRFCHQSPCEGCFSVQPLKL